MTVVQMGTKYKGGFFLMILYSCLFCSKYFSSPITQPYKNPVNPFSERKLRSREIKKLLKSHRASRDGARIETQPRGPRTLTPLHHIPRTAVSDATKNSLLVSSWRTMGHMLRFLINKRPELFLSN